MTSVDRVEETTEVSRKYTYFSHEVLADCPSKMWTCSWQVAQCIF